ncbi:hypothetical protein [Zunongwangia sp. H14]|uniref:hypothetical protein n=1 Tax=Zunongwangia sp. H14 TaxID=3240792 RepID=UPI00356467C4
MPTISIFKKIYFFSRNQIKSGLERIRTINRRKKTIALRNLGHSDLKRWENLQELDASWDERTFMMASLIEPNSKVIEFGAGKMSLKSRLPENCTYQASDLIARHPGVIECDLNQNIQIDLSKYNTAVFSGVLEYVYDIEKVILKMSYHIENIVLSYACSDISNAPRLDRGWLSDYPKKELEKMFDKYNYKILEYKEWRNQSIFSLQSKLDKK